MIIARGRGNKEWNYSAPHGAGRLYSRAKAKELFNVEEFKKSMEGIYSSCISLDTLDEAPFAYKDSQMIKKLIQPSAEIIAILKPIYNFKALD
jgi:RNA-splicing ligase RtcB